MKSIGCDVVVRGRAEGCEVNCLVDTGSHVTLVNASLLRQLGISEVERTKFVLSSFTEDKIDTLGEVKLRLQIAGTDSHHSCIVVKDSMDCDILLGMDFIRAQRLCVNGEDNMLTSRSGCTKFLTSPTPVIRRIKIRASATVILPANSITFVKGKLPDQRIADKNVVYSGHLEPYTNLCASELFAAEALTRC